MTALQSLKAWVPQPVKQRVRKWLLQGGHPLVPQVKQFGCALDLYFWMNDDRTDTLVPIANYFSVYFPDLETATTAELELLDPSGRYLGSESIPVGHMATPLIRVSELRRRLGLGADVAYGNLLWHLRVPPAVAARFAGATEPVLFWDRSYIGYSGPDQQVAFVHGVDKALVINHDGRRIDWPIGSRDSFTARPEIPLLIAPDETTEIVVQNRARSTRPTMLTATDRAGRRREWSVDVASFGVHRYVLNATTIADLDLASPLALQVSNLPTRYGRPIVFRRSASGALSAMHC